MAKKVEEKEVPKFEVAPEAPTLRLPKLGERVLYYKSIATQSGSKMSCYVADITSIAPNGNYQPKDRAVNLTTIPMPGGSTAHEVKEAVMHSDNPMAGRWSFLD